MKRGNTALKRVVSVASVAAMAIAGAVLAAPAASAFTAASGVDVRATPVADSAFVADDGSVASTARYTNDYDGSVLTSTGGTGAVPFVKFDTKNQRASSAQIELPVSGTADTNWKAGDVLTATLPAGVTFNQAPKVDVDGSLIDLAQLTTLAGYSGTKATEPAYSPAPAALTGLFSSATLANSGRTLVLTFAKGDPGNKGALTGTPGYLVTLNDVRLDVAEAPTLTTNAVTLSVDTWSAARTTAAVADDHAYSSVWDNAGTPTATTSWESSQATIAFGAPLTITADGSYAANSKTVTIPDITVSETAKAGFGNGAYVLSISAPKADSSAAQTLGGTVTASVSGSTTIAASAVSTGGFTLAGTDSGKVESVTLKGITITNVKADADISVSLTGLATAVPTFGGATFAQTPDQDGPTVQIGSEVNPPRIAGDNRYETAVDVAKQFKDASSTALDSVVIANGDAAKLGVDALSANFLAGATNSPILLTSANSLPRDTELGLISLFKNSAEKITVYVMGKNDSVSAAVRDQIESTLKATINAAGSVTLKEVAGDNRYETSAEAVATAGSSALTTYNFGNGYVKSAFLASGQTNADALAAGAVSAKAGIPVLLVQEGATELNKAVSDELTSANVKQIFILGGTDRVSADLEKALKDGGYAVTRIFGEGANGRYDTAVKVNEFAFKATADQGLGFTTAGKTAYLASGGAGWPDALTVGPLAGLNSNPLLTVPVDTLPTSTTGFLKDHTDLSAVVALGQSDRIADSVITAAQKAIVK